jgi:hypothetical protein
VAWDRDRPVPWKRLLGFVGIYSMVVLGIFAVIKPSSVLRSVPGLALGASVALLLMAVLTKFGWNPTMLRSRADIAAAKAQRAAARESRKRGASSSSSSSSSGSEATGEAPARPKPPPTRRTSKGPTNNPRRTRDTRKR